MEEKGIVIIEEIFKVPAEKVWKAISDLSEMKKWYFGELEAFEAKKGFETQFNISFDGKDYLHIWKIKDVEQGKKIVCEWRYGGYTGASDVTMEVFSENENTRFRLTQNGINTFNQEDRDFTEESFREGWNYFISNSLKNYLEGKKDN